MEICPKKAFFALKLAKNPKDQLGPHSMTGIRKPFGKKKEFTELSPLEKK